MTVPMPVMQMLSFSESMNSLHHLGIAARRGIEGNFPWHLNENRTRTLVDGTLAAPNIAAERAAPDWESSNQ